MIENNTMHFQCHEAIPPYFRTIPPRKPGLDLFLLGVCNAPELQFPFENVCDHFRQQPAKKPWEPSRPTASIRV